MIRSLLDIDFYKYTMLCCVAHQFPYIPVEYKFICRTKDVDLRPYLPLIKVRIKDLCHLKLSWEEREYLKSYRFLDNGFIDSLEDFHLKERCIEIKENEDVSGKVDIKIKGTWSETILFETAILSIISEIYMKGKVRNDRLEIDTILSDKIKYIKSLDILIKFADFGTRRRYSAATHEFITIRLAKELPINFLGTSNVLLSWVLKIKAIGTHSHEFISAGQGLGIVPLVKSQKFMLETWAKEFRGDLGIALTDTIGMDAFLEDFDLYLAKLYSGCRHDSGNPYIWGEKLIRHYEKLGIDPITKTAVFSDGLNFEKAYEIAKYFKDKIKIVFGIGTHLTNHTHTGKPLSIVIKLIKMNNFPVAKISDEPEKAVCEDEEFLKYLKKVYKVN